MLVHVRTRGNQHKKRRKKEGRQWPKRPSVPFCHRECNAKTTRGWHADKLAAALMRYAICSPRQAGTLGSAVTASEFTM